MILSKEIKIKKTDNLNSSYVDNKLKEIGIDVISWAIVDVDNENYTLNVSMIE